MKTYQQNSFGSVEQINLYETLKITNTQRDGQADTRFSQREREGVGMEMKCGEREREFGDREEA